MKTILSMLVILVAHTTLAGTAIYKEGTFKKAALNGEGDSEKLYKALDIVELEGRTDFAKNFTTDDEVVQIYCTHSKLEIPGAITHACTVSIDLKSKSKETAVYKEDGYVHASINNVTNAQELFTALKVKPTHGRSGDSKLYKTSDEKVEIICSNSRLPGALYSCTVSIGQE